MGANYAKGQREIPLAFGSGSWIRTSDLRVMSPTSYHCSIPRRNMNCTEECAARQMAVVKGPGTGPFSHGVATAVS